MKSITLILLPLFALACVTAALPATVTPVPSATPRPTAYIEDVTDAVVTRLETYTAATDTNLRVCGGLDCDIIEGDAILGGDSFVATRPVGNGWALIPGRGWFCVAALTGGGCEK